MKEYCTLLIKMALNTPKKAKATKNSDLVEVKMLFGLWCVFQLLEVVHNLIKFSQLWYVSVCDFISIMKICKRMFTNCIMIIYIFQVPYVP
jgi:hypothetical protein